MTDTSTLNMFRETVWEQYKLHGRHDLPWRQPEPNESFDPYKILVSELMLQQTQVSRVIPKYLEFIERFPTTASLAGAELGDVLRAWSGLGYNRRAKFLKQAAEAIESEFSGVFPSTEFDLVRLPGVGKNTAGAVLAYAFNEPAVFVETNIRTVYTHHFFQDETDIADKAIAEAVAETVDHENPREWYWALMDYGSQLKRSGLKLNALSKSYTRQSAFHGSKRQVRGKVLKALHHGPLPFSELDSKVADERLETVLEELLEEGMIRQNKEGYRL